MEALLVEREGAGEHDQSERAEAESEQKAPGVRCVQAEVEDGAEIHRDRERSEGEAGEKEEGDAGAKRIDEDGAVLVAVGVGLASARDERGEEAKQGLEQEVHAKEDS